MSEFRVLVCGGRYFNDWRAIYKGLNELGRRPTLVIHGAASGVDDWAAKWADANKIPWLSFPAEWGKHGRAAGPIRNQQMIDDGRPDLVVAFPGGVGTADMVRRAEAAGIPVRRVR